MWKGKSGVIVRRSPLIVCLTIAVFFFSACSNLNRSDKPATKTWWLEPYGQSIPTALPNESVSLEVSVTVVPGLDTYRILTLSDAAEMNKYSGARWADSLPELMTSLVSRSLEASGRFQMVSNHRGSTDCDLELELQRFYTHLDTSGRTTEVQVTMSGRYKCAGSKPEIIKTDATVAVNDDRMSVIVGAFQQAFDAVIGQLLDQI